jgi:Spy/CpxP family protein refolding chaperone
LPARSNILLGVLASASCLLIGFALSTLAYRYHYLRVPGGSGLIERINLELNLTPAQRDRIGDILRDTRFKVMQSRRDFEHRRHELFWQGLSDIRGVLTPEQQQIFDRDFKQPWEHHGHGGEGDHMEPEEGAEPPPPPPVAPPPPPHN